MTSSPPVMCTYNDGVSCSGIHTGRIWTFECDTMTVHNDDTECASYCDVYQNLKYLSSRNTTNIKYGFAEPDFEIKRSQSAGRLPNDRRTDYEPIQRIVRIKADANVKTNFNSPLFRGRDPKMTTTTSHSNWSGKWTS